MKKRMVILLTGICASLLALSACAGDPQNNIGYGEENGGTPDGPSAVFYPDGVFDDAAYESVEWLKNYALDPEEADHDLDRVRTLAAEAAQLNMTVFFRSGGMCAAFDVTNAEGTAAWVNAERDISLNSGVELSFGGYRAKLCPDGSYEWQRKEDGSWTPYTAAEACVLGAQAKTAPVNDAANTGYSMEFFVPAAVLEEMGVDASSLAQGEETLQLDAVLVTSYGSEETAADRWSMGSLLSWGQGLQFGRDGAKVYDITIETTGLKGTSAVAEAGLRDYTVPNDDTTFLVKEADGYRLKSFTVNGVEYDVQYVQGGFEKGYVTLLTDEVDSDLHVKAEFEKKLPVSFEAAAEGLRLGRRVALDGVDVTFRGEGSVYTFRAEAGTIAGRLPRGVYSVSVSSDAYEVQEVAFDGREMGRLQFNYRAFEADKFSDAYGGYLDYSLVNRENGALINIDGNSFLPVTNEAFGDSAFTATFRASQMTKESRLGIRYIWNDKTNEKQMRNAVIAELNMQNGALRAGWADYSDNWNNYNVAYSGSHKNTLPSSFAAAFRNGSGVSLTVVRSGDVFSLYAATADNEASRIFVMDFTLGSEALKGKDGHWAIFIWDSANGIEVPFRLDEEVPAWHSGRYAVTDETDADAHGSVVCSSDLSVGSPVTFTVTPEKDYALLSFKVNGEEYASRMQGNTLTFTENIPLAMTVRAVFGAENYTVNADLSGAEGRLTQDDLDIAFDDGTGLVRHARYDGGNAWKVSLAAGTYTYHVYAFGGFALKSGSMTAEEGGTFELPLTAADLDIAIPDRETNGTEQILGGLGTIDTFVYSGYMGLEGSEIEDISRFAAETRFRFANGGTMELQFVRWDNTYEIKFMINEQNNGVSYMLTSERAPGVFERVLADDGVWFTVSVQDGVASVWAKNADDEWEPLRTWENSLTWDGVVTDLAISQVEFRMRYDGTEGDTAVLRDTVFRIGASAPEM